MNESYSDYLLTTSDQLQLILERTVEVCAIYTMWVLEYHVDDEAGLAWPVYLLLFHVWNIFN